MKKTTDELIVKYVSCSYSNNKNIIRTEDDIIPDISIFSNTSINLHPKQVSLFNAVRFGLEICNNSYKELIKSLSKLTDKNDFGLLEFPLLYSHIWNIINHSDLIHQIIKREFPKTNFGSLFKEINKTRKIRNSQQHIDERLDDMVFENDFSIYGSLIWSKYYKEKNEIIISSIYSGTISNKEKMSMKMENFIDNERPDSLIQQIEFAYITANRKKNLKKQFINIKQIMYDLQKISKMLINELNNIKNTKTHHQTDLMIRLKGNLKRTK